MPDAIAEANSAPSISPTIIHESELARVLISLSRLRFVLELFRFRVVFDAYFKSVSEVIRFTHAGEPNFQ